MTQPMTSTAAAPRDVADATDASRIVFLGGAPRSGTTLVQNMLDSHPEILGGPEFLHVPDIVGVRDKLQGSVGRGWIDLICSREAVDDAVRSLLTSLLLGFADRHGARLLSEKTPENVLVFPKLLQLFPESKLIFVVRDPRGTVASMLAVAARARAKGEAPAPFTASPQAAVAYLRRCLDAGFAAAAADPARVLTVVYERIVADPEAESRRICAFLGVPWDDAMLRPGDKPHLGEAAITVNSKEIWYDADTYKSNPSTEQIDKWKETLRPRERLFVERAFRSSAPLRAMGYRLEADPMPTLVRARATLGCLLDELRMRIAGRLRRTLRRMLGDG